MALTILVYGGKAGTSAVAVRFGVNEFYQRSLFRLPQRSFSVLFEGSFVPLIGSSLVVAWLLNSFPSLTNGAIKP